MTHIQMTPNQPFNNQYPKLVRDRIPEIIYESEGVQVSVRLLEDDAEYERFLRRKIVEEAVELAEAETNIHTIEEMADLEELVDTLLALKGLNRARLTAAQTEKRRIRGGFTHRILMLQSSEMNQN